MRKKIGMLNEYAAVRNNDKAYELGKIIYIDLLKAYKQNSNNLNGKGVKRFKKTYNLELVPNINIPVRVTYPKNENSFYLTDEKEIVLNVSYEWNQQMFFDVFFHEITHAMDYLIFNMLLKRGRHFGMHYIPKQTRFLKLTGRDKVNSVLYRLWDTSERNAYQLNAILGETYCNEYIDNLKKDIEYLNKIPSEKPIWDLLKYYVDVYKIIKCPKRFKSSKQTFKNFFIKKSYYLLELFTKRMFKNLKYFNENPIQDLTLQDEEPQIISTEPQKNIRPNINPKRANELALKNFFSVFKQMEEFCSKMAQILNDNVFVDIDEFGNEHKFIKPFKFNVDNINVELMDIDQYDRNKNFLAFDKKTNTSYLVFDVNFFNSIFKRKKIIYTLYIRPIIRSIFKLD